MEPVSREPGASADRALDHDPGSDGVAWEAFEAAAPALAVFVRDRLDAHRHRLMATIRADGSPRISGTELLIHGGELWIGGLPGSLKFRDLRRDPRIAVHSNPEDPPGWVGDARLSGLAVLVDDDPGKAAFKAAWEAAMGSFPPGPFELLRLRIREVSTVREASTKDHLLIDLWRPGEAVRTLERW
jgi:hypothetical protein